MPSNPIAAVRFRVEIDSIDEAGFSECSGLTVETDVEERREGGLNHFVHRLPKGTKYTNIVLKRGITQSASLWDWYQNVVQGLMDKRNVSIVLLAADGSEALRWNLERAFPVKWVGPEFRAEGNALAIEQIELAHHGFKKA